MRAEAEGDLRSGLVEIAGLLGLPEAQAQEQDLAVEAARRWLSTHDGWLLVFDNADQPEVLGPFLPRDVRGQVLLTSRAQSFAALGIGKPFRMPTLPPEDALAFLLERADREDASDDERQAAGELARELGYLPLALEQAAAYMAATGARFGSYLESFRTRRLKLLEEVGPEAGDYPASVATTWSLSFREVEDASAAAGDLLRVLAFLAPDAVPAEIFEEGAAELGPHLADALGDDLLALSKVLAPLLRYSLVERDAEERTVSVHRLVQAVARADLDEQAERRWAERVVRALDAAYPGSEFKVWPLCERLYPQQLEAAGHIERMAIELTQAARLLNQAGFYAKERARYEEAEPLYERSLAVREKALGPEHPDVGTALNNLALLYHHQGRHEESKPLFERSLAIREKALGPEHPAVGTALNNLAGLYRAQGRSEEAEPLYERSLAIREKALGPEHPDVATSLNDLAGLYCAQGRHEEAEPLYERSLAICEKALGPEHPDVGKALNNLAALYRHQRRYDEAEPLYERSLAIYEKALGAEHPHVGAPLNNLAALYHAQGRHKEAEPLYERSLAISEKALGPEHPHTVLVRKNLSALRADPD